MYVIFVESIIESSQENSTSFLFLFFLLLMLYIFFKFHHFHNHAAASFEVSLLTKKLHKWALFDI